MEQDDQQQRHDGEDAGVADDSDVAQLHVAIDDSAQSGKGERLRSYNVCFSDVS